jgi:ubiquinone/menaquinone biosynthesis C-methylase UbiE
MKLMNPKKQLSPKEEDLYFEVQADFGITKHLGGLGITKELIELCNVGKGKNVLEVGCGVGKTPCFLAEKYDLKIVGIDISEEMIKRSRERVKRKGLEGRIDFKVADAQNIPYKDNTFDAVICESVTAFIENKSKAVNEYVRVTKPQGFVGLNECHWIKPPPDDLIKYTSHVIGGADFRSSDGWKKLLEDAGLTDIKVKTYKLTPLNQFIGEVSQMDFRDYTSASYRFLTQGFTNPAYRRFAKEVLSSPKNIFKLFEYLGYGVYVGKKKG